MSRAGRGLVRCSHYLYSPRPADKIIFKEKRMKRLNLGCGKDVKTLWNYGSYVIVKCGFEEPGFMPVLCDDCKKKT